MNDTSQAVLGTLYGATILAFGRIAEWFLDIDGTALVTSIIGFFTMAMPWISRAYVKHLETKSQADEVADLKVKHAADEHEKQQLRDRLDHLQAELSQSRARYERLLDETP